LEAKNNGFMPEDVSERKVTQRVPVRVVKELVDKFAREEIASNSPIEGIIYGWGV
jgi:hypothetical protein